MKHNIGDRVWVEIFYKLRHLTITGFDGDKAKFRETPYTAPVDQLFRTEGEYWNAKAAAAERECASYRAKALQAGYRPKGSAESSVTDWPRMLRFVVLVRSMREAQREYFKQRHRDKLLTAKEREHAVDRAIAELEK